MDCLLSGENNWPLNFWIITQEKRLQMFKDSTIAHFIWTEYEKSAFLICCKFLWNYKLIFIQAHLIDRYDDVNGCWLVQVFSAHAQRLEWSVGQSFLSERKQRSDYCTSGSENRGLIVPTAVIENLPRSVLVLCVLSTGLLPLHDVMKEIV